MAEPRRTFGPLVLLAGLAAGALATAGTQTWFRPEGEGVVDCEAPCVGLSYGEAGVAWSFGLVMLAMSSVAVHRIPAFMDRGLDAHLISYATALDAVAAGISTFGMGMLVHRIPARYIGAGGLAEMSRTCPRVGIRRRLGRDVRRWCMASESFSVRPVLDRHLWDAARRPREARSGIRLRRRTGALDIVGTLGPIRASPL